MHDTIWDEQYWSAMRKVVVRISPHFNQTVDQNECLNQVGFSITAKTFFLKRWLNFASYYIL